MKATRSSSSGPSDPPPTSRRSGRLELRRRAPLAGGAPQLFELLPVPADGVAALRRERDGGVWHLALERLDDRDEAAAFELGQVAGQVAFGQSRQRLEEQEVGPAAGGERRENREARGIVDQAAQSGQLFERRALHDADPAAREDGVEEKARRSTRSSPIAATASPPPMRPSSAAARISSGTPSTGRSANIAHAAAMKR